MFLGAAGVAAAAVAHKNHLRLQDEVRALASRVDQVETATGAHTGAIDEVRNAVARMEHGFSLLGDRLGTQIDLLESLQSSYNDKEEKLQAALRAVLDAVAEMRPTQ